MSMEKRDSSAKPAFAKVPQSALLSRLEAFLPAMADENKKLDEAVAAGQGAKHCIEADGSDEEDEAESSDALESEKPPVIEMNFALGMMENDQNSDAESSDSDAEDKSDIILSASAAAEQSKSFSMAISRPSSKPRPVIQELD